MGERKTKERARNQRTAARTQKMRARNIRLIHVFVTVILICGAFAGGFMVRDHPHFLQGIGFPESVTGLPTTVTDQSDSKDTYNSVSKRVAEVEERLSADSLDTYDLANVTKSTLEAFAESTNDPYMR